MPRHALAPSGNNLGRHGVWVTRRSTKLSLGGQCDDHNVTRNCVATHCLREVRTPRVGRRYNERPHGSTESPPGVLSVENSGECLAWEFMTMKGPATMSQPKAEFIWGVRHPVIRRKSASSEWNLRLPRCRFLVRNNFRFVRDRGVDHDSILTSRHIGTGLLLGEGLTDCAEVKVVGSIKFW